MKRTRTVLGRPGARGDAREHGGLRAVMAPLRSPRFRAGAAAAVAAVVVACGDADVVSAQAQQSVPAAVQAGDFIPQFTIAEVMEAVVMPAADVVWNAPQFPDEGDEILGPDTEEGWLAVRHGAIALAESANLLIVPGRKAHPADKELNEGELTAAEIEALIAANRGAWLGWARTLHAAALESLAAIDARDADKLLDAGGTLDSACQGCHMQFWYPNQQQ